MVFFFQKKFRYLKSKISTKFHHLLFCFYVFGILFFISRIPTCSKIRIFCSVLLEGLEILPIFVENSKSSFKKILIC